MPIVAGGILVILFSLERIVLRLSGAPIDMELDELAPAEIAIELGNAEMSEGAKTRAAKG